MSTELAIYDAAMAYAEATANSAFETMRTFPDPDAQARADQSVSDTYRALLATLSADTKDTMYSRPKSSRSPQQTAFTSR